MKPDGAKSLKLSKEQQAQLEAEFGQPVPELHYAVTEFGVEDGAGSKLKVLQISNVAQVQVKGVSSVVN